MACFRIIVWLILLAPPLCAQASDMAVVVNVKNPTIRLSSADLRKIFAGEKRTWPGGIPVKLILRNAGAREHDAVLRLLRFSEPEFREYWIAQVYRGDSAEPVAVFSNGMQKEAVMSIPGAIALIAVDDVKLGTKVLKIDNKLPGQEGYPLH